MELRLELKSPDVDGGSQTSPLPLWPQRRPQNGKSPARSGKDDVSAIDRLRREGGGALKAVWQQLLSYTVECILDPRWELRRMGDQVLPLLTQAIYWYDLGILLELWDGGLSVGGDVSPATSTAAL